MRPQRRRQLPDHQRRQADCRFVHQQQFWPSHQAAREGEDLLLAAGQVAGMLPLPRLQDREAGKHRLDIDPDRGCVAAQKRPHFQVLPHRHAREQPFAFRHVDQAALQTLARGDRIDPLAVETHLTRGQRCQPGYGAQARGLAGAVGADQSDGLAVVDRQRHAVQHAGGAVRDHDVTNLKQHLRRPPRQDRPRSPPGPAPPQPASPRRSCGRTAAR